MSNPLKRIGVVVGVLVGFMALAMVVAYFAAEARLNKTYDIPPEAIVVPTDAASLERGRRLAAAIRCTECHAENLGGRIMDDNPAVGLFVATNLTSGKGGVGGEFSDADWARALRHGIGPDGQSLIITPAQYYYYLSDADLGAMIAYLKRLPPIDNELPATTLGPLGRLILLLPQSDWLPAEKIDHTSPRPAAPEPGVTAAYGEYLVRIGNCKVCHVPESPDDPAGWSELRTQKFRGGQPPDTIGYLSHWSEADFITAMRTGVTPDGDPLDSDSMPWMNIGQMTDDELKAIWLYLQSPPVPRTGSR
jgi:mono/diheme cytochrome c family protein